MAKSAYEYVKQFELDDRLLPSCWIVVRVDGKGFTRYWGMPGGDGPGVGGDWKVALPGSRAGGQRFHTTNPRRESPPQILRAARV